MNINTYSKSTGENTGKVIRRASIARAILAAGGDKVRIIDVKGDRTDPDHKRSVFIFRDDNDFQEVLGKVLEENKKAREQNYREATEKLQKEYEELLKKYNELSPSSEVKGE